MEKVCVSAYKMLTVRSKHFLSCKVIVYYNLQVLVALTIYAVCCRFKTRLGHASLVHVL